MNSYLEIPNARLYKTVSRSVLTYGCYTCAITKHDEELLGRFERRRMDNSQLVIQTPWTKEQGKPKLRYMDDVEDDIKILGVRGWRRLMEGCP